MQPLMAKTCNTKLAVGDMILKQLCAWMKLVVRDNLAPKATW